MRRTLQATVIGLVVALFAIPASAEECQTVTFDNGYITSRSGNTETVRTGLIAPFLWVQYGENIGQDELENTVSVNIGTAASATVCPDGTVTLTAPAASDSGEDAPTAPEVIDLVDQYPDVLAPRPAFGVHPI